MADKGKDCTIIDIKRDTIDGRYTIIFFSYIFNFNHYLSPFLFSALIYLAVRIIPNRFVAMEIPSNNPEKICNRCFTTSKRNVCNI